MWLGCAWLNSTSMPFGWGLYDSLLLWGVCLREPWLMMLVWFTPRQACPTAHFLLWLLSKGLWVTIVPFPSGESTRGGCSRWTFPLPRASDRPMGGSCASLMFCPFPASHLPCSLLIQPGQGRPWWWVLSYLGSHVGTGGMKGSLFPSILSRGWDGKSSSCCCLKAKWHLLSLFFLPPFFLCCSPHPCPIPMCFEENKSRVHEQFSWTETNDLPPFQGQVILGKTFPLFKEYMHSVYREGRSYRGAQWEPCGLASLLCGSLTSFAEHLLPGSKLRFSRPGCLVNPTNL